MKIKGITVPDTVQSLVILFSLFLFTIILVFTFSRAFLNIDSE